MYLLPEKSTKLDLSYNIRHKATSLFINGYLAHTKDYISQITMIDSGRQITDPSGTISYNLMLSTFRRSVPEGTWASAISPTFLPIKAAPIGDFNEILPASRFIS